MNSIISTHVRLDWQPSAARGEWDGNPQFHHVRPHQHLRLRVEQTGPTTHRVQINDHVQTHHALEAWESPREQALRYAEAYLLQSLLEVEEKLSDQFQLHARPRLSWKHNQKFGKDTWTTHPGDVFRLWVRTGLRSNVLLAGIGRTRKYQTLVKTNAVDSLKLVMEQLLVSLTVPIRVRLQVPSRQQAQPNHSYQEG